MLHFTELIHMKFMFWKFTDAEKQCIDINCDECWWYYYYFVDAILCRQWTCCNNVWLCIWIRNMDASHHQIVYHYVINILIHWLLLHWIIEIKWVFVIGTFQEIPEDKPKFHHFIFMIFYWLKFLYPFWFVLLSMHNLKHDLHCPSSISICSINSFTYLLR